MNFKASKPDARILILQIVAASILSFYFKSQLATFCFFLVIDFLLVRGKSIFPKACCVCVLKCFDLGLAYRGDSRSFGCASVIPYDDRPGVSNLFAP